MNPRDRKLRLKKSTLRQLGPEHSTHAVGGGPPVIGPDDSDKGDCTCTCVTCNYTACDSCPPTHCLDDSCQVCPYSNPGFTVCVDLCA